MKKIRILALILALLMLPLGILVSCKKDDTDPDDGDDEGDGGSTPTIPSTSTSVNVDDGKKAGYLCYFNFNKAPLGPFTSEGQYQPYSFFVPDKTKEGANYVYGRRDENGRGGYLGIERDKAKSAPYYDLTVLSLPGLDASHVISFDIYLGGGVMKDTASLIGRKTKAGIFNTFLTFYTDGSIVASGKYKFYTAKSSGEWVNIAVAIDDANREFDVYVNGVKTLVDIEYATVAYGTWEAMKIDRYRIQINAGNTNTTELRLDNFAVNSGLVPQNAKDESAVIYTDIYTERGEIFGLGGVEESKKKILDIYSFNSGLMDTVKKDAYSSKLLMSNSVALSKLSSTGAGVDLQYDYGVETGKYKYGASMGGKTFYSDPQIGKSFEFRSDVVKEGVEIGNLIVVDENGRQGTYTLVGDEDLIKITIKIDNVITYAVYTDGVFKTVSDDSFDPNDTKAIVYNEGSFHGKTYSYNFGSTDDSEGNKVSVTVTPDEINGNLDFSMQVNDTVYIDEKNITYNFDYGILTFQIDGRTYVFAYDDVKDELELILDDDLKSYDFEDGDGNLTLKLPAIESVYISEDDVLALHYQGFGSGSGTLAFPVNSETAKLKPWEKFYFEIYIPDKMINFTFGLYLYCGTDYYYTVLQFPKEGLYEKGIPLEEFTKSGNPNINNITKVEFKMFGNPNGTAYGPYADTNGVLGNDGYGFYILNMALLQEKIAVVEGPEKNKEHCVHRNDEGVSHLVALEDPIPASCESIGYYAKKCSECGATVIDDEKPITDALGHDTEGQDPFTRYPTCDDAGYTYHYCKRCNVELKLSEIPVLSHEYHEILNNAAGRMDYRCKHCGHKYSTYLNSTLVSGKEKYETLLPTDSKTFIVYEGFNDTVKVGDFNGVSSSNAAVGGGNLSYWYGYAMLTATTVGSNHCVEFVKGDTKNVASYQNYFDMNVGSTSFGQGATFVIELDIMPGKTGADGKYTAFDFQMIDRTTNPEKGADGKPKPIFAKLFSINENAEIIIGDYTVELDTKNFTNIAVVVDPGAGLLTLYKNGVFAASGAPAEASKIKSNFCVERTRILVNESASQDATGASYYFNSVFVYKSDLPVCLINTELVDESKGSLGLYDSATPAEDAKPVTEFTVTADKTVFLKPTDKSSDYTFSFKLKATAALATGVLLKGNKLDGYDKGVSADLLTVKNGYIWFMDDIPIHKLVEGEEITIKLYCEDYLSRVTVTVNDKEILTRIPYGTGDTYSDADAYVRSYTFGSAVGEYSITDISFVTTAKAE